MPECIPFFSQFFVIFEVTSTDLSVAAILPTFAYFFIAIDAIPVPDNNSMTDLPVNCYLFIMIYLASIIFASQRCKP